MQGPNLAPGLDKSWPAHVEFQSIAFSAAACYWEVCVCVCVFISICRAIQVVNERASVIAGINQNL